MTSGSRQLDRLSRDGAVRASNADPFVGWLAEGNHLGDIDVVDDVVYAPAERFAELRGHAMHVARFRADTLAFIGALPLDPASDQEEVSGVAVDAAAGWFWLSDWRRSDRLYRYNLADGKLIAVLVLDPPLKWIQGVAIDGDQLLVSADDGDAERAEHDHVWRVKTPLAARSEVTPELALTQVERTGEIEGLSLCDGGSRLVVDHNRGKRILDGHSVGLYPGYEREISEVYVYRRPER